MSSPELEFFRCMLPSILRSLASDDPVVNAGEGGDDGVREASEESGRDVGEAGRGSRSPSQSLDPSGSHLEHPAL